MSSQSEEPQPGFETSKTPQREQGRAFLAIFFERITTMYRETADPVSSTEKLILDAVVVYSHAFWWTYTSTIPLKPLITGESNYNQSQNNAH